MVGRLTVLIFSNSCPSIKWLKFIPQRDSTPLSYEIEVDR